MRTLTTLLSLLLAFTASAEDSQIEQIRQQAINGVADAQYEYALILRHSAIWGQSERMSESIDWFKAAAKKDNPKANGFLALHSAANKDFVGARNHLSTIDSSNDIINDYNQIYLSISAIKTLVRYLEDNPQISITAHGPLGKDEPFIWEKNDTIYACASVKGKAGLLKLDKLGNRIAHDDIPLVYDYIVPMYGENMEFTEAVKDADSHIFFAVSPYLYRLNRSDDTIRVLNIHGNEEARSMWGSEAERVILPEGFCVDSDRGSYIREE